MIFSFGIQFFNSVGFFGVEAELNGTQKVFFGMIITDPEHWRLRLKWWYYHGIIAQRTPYKSHNGKGSWFVLVFDVIMLQAYSVTKHTFNTSIFRPLSDVRPSGTCNAWTKASVNWGKTGNNNCLATPYNKLLLLYIIYI